MASALAFAALDQGGREPVGWDITLLVVGAVTLFYPLAVSPAHHSSPVDRLIGWAILLPPAYIGLQLVPLPLPLLSVLSPARAKLVESLGAITQAPKFAPLSIDPTATSTFLLRTLAYALTALVVYQISAYWCRHRTWAPVVPLIGIAAFEACLGMIQFNDGGSVAGTYRSNDHFAGALEMVLPLAVAYGISRLQDPRSQVSLTVSNAIKACVAFALSAAMMLGLVYSLSKAGFAAGLGALFAMGAMAIVAKVQGARRWLSITSLATAMALIFAFLPTDRLASAYTEVFSHDPKSLEGRAPIWEDSRQLLRDYPLFGTGLGTYGTAFLKYQTAYLDSAYTFAHNDYLQLASELGPVGFLIFGTPLALALVKAIRAACSKEWNTRILGLGCIGALAAIGIHSLADFNLYIPANALLLSWIVGIAMSLPSPSQPTRSRDEADEPAPMHADILRLVSNGAVRVIPVLFACLLVASAAGSIALQAKTASGPDAENVFCRLGICGTDTDLSAEAGHNASAATPAIVEALKRDPAAPHRWCDAGEAFLRSGRAKDAHYCFSRALALGPEIPPILFRSAAFYHATGEDGLALKQGAHVLAISEAYRTAMLDWYRNQKFNINDVLCYGLPPSPQVAQSYLTYWLQLADPGDAKVTWDWILSHHYADLQTARQYVNFLFGNSNYEEAAAAWAHFVGGRRNRYRESNWVFNGDFEDEPSGVPLDWDISSSADQVDAELDPTIARTGTHSLRIQFLGTQNVNYVAWQKTAVPPGAYRLRAFIRTQGITTDKGVAFRIFDPENPSRVDAKTKQFIGTIGWTKVEVTIHVPEETKLLEVQVFREPTIKFDNKVSGTAWIDDVDLSRID